MCDDRTQFDAIIDRVGKALREREYLSDQHSLWRSSLFKAECSISGYKAWKQMYYKRMRELNAVIESLVDEILGEVTWKT